MVTIQPNMDFMVEEEESYPCMSHDCDKVFYVKSDLKKHAQAHAEGMPMHCNKPILHAQNLKFHQQTCERNENRKAYRMFYGVDPDV